MLASAVSGVLWPPCGFAWPTYRVSRVGDHVRISTSEVDRSHTANLFITVVVMTLGWHWYGEWCEDNLLYFRSTQRKMTFWYISVMHLNDTKFAIMNAKKWVGYLNAINQGGQIYNSHLLLPRLLHLRWLSAVIGSLMIHDTFSLDILLASVVARHWLLSKRANAVVPPSHSHLC